MSNPSPDTPTAPASEPGSFQTMVARTVYQEDPRLRSTALATLLSLMPGLGQVYLGYTQLGFVHATVAGALIAILAPGAGALEPLLGLFLAFFWLYNIVDANRRAMLLNQRILGLVPGELPEEVSPSLRGSVLGGLCLIAGGTLALAHVRFGLSMDWVGRWWPVALIGFGVYLVWKAVKASRE